MKENLDKKILRGLYEYQQKNRGAPKMDFKELLTQIREDHAEVVYETLSKLKERNWLEYQLTGDGQAGLINLTSDGIKVAKQIPLIISEPTCYVQLILEGNINEFNETRRHDLINVIAALLNIERQSVRILHVRPSSSIQVVIELPTKVAMELIDLFNARGTLKSEKFVQLMSQFLVRDIKEQTFVPGYAHDIFVSYDKADEDRVFTIIRHLKSQVGQVLGGKDTFSLRKSGDQSHPDDGSAMIAQSATLVIALSHEYLDSRRCQTEREQFFLVNQQKDGYSRVFVVELEAIEERDRPQECSQFKNVYRFYDQVEYFNQFGDFKRQLANMLKDLKSLTEHPDDEKDKATDFRPAVFLAEVTDDLREKRELLKRAFGQEKFRVLPEIPLILGKSEAFCQTVSEQLDQCEVFVQLVSALPGRTCPDQPDLNYSYLQFKQAQQAQETTIIQWRDPQVDVKQVTHEVHQKLLESEYLISRHFEDFKQEVVRKVKQTATQKRTQPPSEAPFVFLNANKEDETLAKQIQSVLKKHQLHHALHLWQGIASSQGDMGSPIGLNNKIVKFLTSVPNIHNESGRRALILSAELDPQLQNQINFGEPPVQFFPLLIFMLIRYGKLKDGRDALEAVLVAAKNYVGQDKKDYCDTLIQELQSYRSPSSQQIISSERLPNVVETYFYTCDGSILVYGETPVEWINIQLRTYLSFFIEPERRKKPIKALALYEGPPVPKEEPAINICGMHICKCHQGLDEREFQPFFDDLNAGSSV